MVTYVNLNSRNSAAVQANSVVELETIEGPSRTGYSSGAFPSLAKGGGPRAAGGPLRSTDYRATASSGIASVTVKPS